MNKSNKSGFTLIELLVVIGILAVLAAIAIPTVAGLIDRANKSADLTNSNEMTNALERFASEYELYKNDIAMGIVPNDDLDTMQGRVFAVTGATTRAEITELETAGNDGAILINDERYPTTDALMKKVVEAYTKTSSSTFEPKQSDKCFWYSPECGVVVVAGHNSSVLEKNELVVSGKDAKGNDLDGETVWLDLTPTGDAIVDDNNGGSGSDEDTSTISIGTYYTETTECPMCGSSYGAAPMHCRSCDYEYQTEGVILTEFPETPTHGDVYVLGCYNYTYNKWDNGWGVTLNGVYDTTQILPSINNVPVVSMTGCYLSSSITDSDLATINIPSSVRKMDGAFHSCNNLKDASSLIIPNTVTNIEAIFMSCENLITTPKIPASVTNLSNFVWDCYNLQTIYADCKFDNLYNSADINSDCEIILEHSINCGH